MYPSSVSCIKDQTPKQLKGCICKDSFMNKRTELSAVKKTYTCSKRLNSDHIWGVNVDRI